MALEIGIGDGRSLIPSEPSLTPKDDGYYWYLYPHLVKLREVTGSYVDLYDDASFQGNSLTALDETLLSAIDLVKSQPETWQVHVGTEDLPEHKELFESVERDGFLDLLHRLRLIVARAKKLDKPIICLGD